ncbi:MAG: ParB/RepB/Spo0J family partition protein [Candidatus Kapaibacteriales bacterium]
MGKNKKEFGLGRGLGSLIPTDFDISNENQISSGSSTTLTNFPFVEIEISKISFNPFQPRKEFDASQFEDLVNSIRENGVIQPITVREIDSGYQIISGERRTRAALKAGLTTIPAYIIKVEEDHRLLELALIENIQREDLNPIDLANAYKKLIEDFNYTQEELAKKVGKDRSTLSNILRLLKLPINIQDSIKKEQISLGHAKALLAIEDNDTLQKVWKKVVKENLSVRQTEHLVNLVKLRKSAIPNKITKKDENLLAIEKELIQILGTNVSIHHKNKKGKIIIEFYSNEDFLRIIDFILSHRSS